MRDDDGTQYALKLLNSQTATKVKRKRFSKEIQVCLCTQHQHVIPVLDHGVYTQPGQNATIPFYVMPTVEAAHLKGVVHRDLKPENVLYDPAHDALVVADFSIAHFSEEESVSSWYTHPQRHAASSAKSILP